MACPPQVCPCFPRTFPAPLSNPDIPVILQRPRRRPPVPKSRHFRAYFGAHQGFHGRSMVYRFGLFVSMVYWHCGRDFLVHQTNVFDFVKQVETCSLAVDWRVSDRVPGGRRVLFEHVVGLWMEHGVYPRAPAVWDCAGLVDEPFEAADALGESFTLES